MVGKLLVTITSSTCSLNMTGANTHVCPTFILCLRGILEYSLPLVYLLLTMFLLLFSPHDLLIHLTQFSSVCVTEIARYLLLKWCFFLRREQRGPLMSSLGQLHTITEMYVFNKHVHWIICNTCMSTHSNPTQCPQKLICATLVHTSPELWHCFSHLVIIGPEQHFI